MKIADVVRRYEELTQRAMFIVNGPPYDGYIREIDLPHLRIKGRKAILSKINDLEAQRRTIDRCDVFEFPVGLLALDDEKIKEWKLAQIKAYGERMRARQMLQHETECERDRLTKACLKRAFCGLS